MILTPPPIVLDGLLALGPIGNTTRDDAGPAPSGEDGETDGGEY